MTFLEIFLFSCLAFAALVLFLIGVVYIRTNCCNPQTPKISSEIEDGIPLNQVSILREPVPTTSRSTAYPVPSAPPSEINSSPRLPTKSDICTKCGSKRPRTISATSIESHISPEELRNIQTAVLKSVAPKTARITDQNSLLIGVHANSMVSSGYCINLQENWVEFYAIQTEHLLSTHIENPDDDSDFEMNNFFFALMLWYEKIASGPKRLQIYTGSRATAQDNNRLWRRAAKLMEHFWNCEKISVGNDNQYFVNPRKDATAFSIKILPAEDLSEGRFLAFSTFLSSYYNIPKANFIGTHLLDQNRQHPGMSNVTNKYQEYIDKVISVRKKWNEPCRKCTYVDEEAGTL